ncbi:hypothetical protein EV663_11924 [Rhodovulum bhavnagarense]|uniref:Uncharacterized protein n=1 Tax=Rhodovulum bhavnagarense TaxID=992286 RepID=A0A4R2R8V3_9RHOB|nr:hypothetical protein EV663_11924 [Rhodovulum bhavnagarense]
MTAHARISDSNDAGAGTGASAVYARRRQGIVRGRLVLSRGGICNACGWHSARRRPSRAKGAGACINGGRTVPNFKELNP